MTNFNITLPKSGSNTGRPAAEESGDYFKGYIDKTSGNDPVQELIDTADELLAYLKAVPESRETNRYAEGKWSIREMLGHIIDTDRVFAYRAMTFARGDDVSLPGFEQDDWVLPSGAHQRPLTDLNQEFIEQRSSLIRMFASLPDEAWTRTGTASGSRFSVRAIAFLLAGHVRHHLNILQERYGEE